MYRSTARLTSVVLVLATGALSSACESSDRAAHGADAAASTSSPQEVAASSSVGPMTSPSR
jgi:hypothetical protein